MKYVGVHRTGTEGSAGVRAKKGALPKKPEPAADPRFLDKVCARAGRRSATGGHSATLLDRDCIVRR